jgi:GT2 family glycosyltransferase
MTAVVKTPTSGPDRAAGRTLINVPTPAVISTRRVQTDERIRVSGKFLVAGNETFYVRGVTYGAFQPDANGDEYKNLRTIESDFAVMAASGVNAVRIPHTTPPIELLDIAADHGLRVMVGLSCEQYLGHLEDGKGFGYVERVVRKKVQTIANHPALLCYALGNEIPAPMARWHGRQRVERYLKRLYLAVKEEDPGALVTYVNYPSTEYLRLPFLDLFSFNVYLESQESFRRYLSRLHNIAGDKPLIMSEIGLDSIRNGDLAQASALDRQIRDAFELGCAGTFVFAWTDEWCRAGIQVDDWAFGITDRQRQPKPAFSAVRDAYQEAPFFENKTWPMASVVLCTFNGARTIRECCEGLRRLSYQNYEVVVVDDGSSDGSAQIASEFNFRVITTENRGLGSARNTGIRAARGEIIAFIDDDAFPDANWLTYLVNGLIGTDHVGVGGPNIPPYDDGAIAECVACAPGGPVHVLLSDTLAEHVPGCNMAFRRSALEEVGGFDPQFRTAGDDVDLCWRLQDRGWTIGFHPAAVVWHHRRSSLRAYWRQQVGYGRAEAMLERKWPEKYNPAGHVNWGGRVYGNGFMRSLGRVQRVYHGSWCSAPFQTLHERPPGLLRSLLQIPEWNLILAALTLLSVLGVRWRPLLWCIPLLTAGATLSIAQAMGSARSSLAARSPIYRNRKQLLLLTGLLYLIQPIARLSGRMRHGLTPWRHRTAPFAFPWPRKIAVWSERWREPISRLSSLESGFRSSASTVIRGGDYDHWDLEIRKGALGAVRMVMGPEDHGAGKQYLRFRFWPRFQPSAILTVGILMLIAFYAGSQGAYDICAGFLLLATWLGWRALRACAMATAVTSEALQSLAEREKSAFSDRSPVVTNGVQLVREPIVQTHSSFENERVS